jgi:hypothetical protein
MSTRCKPVKAVGAVNVLAPSAKSPYFRLTWIEPDGRPGRTSGNRTLAQAMSKANGIDAGLQRATGPKGLTPLGQVMEEYLASPVRRNQKTKKDWSPSHHRQASQVLHRVLRGHESCPALTVDRTMADSMRAQAGTERTVTENTSMLRGLLRWGNVHGCFSAGQAEMFPNKCATVAPALKGTSAPDRRRKGRKVTETVEHVRDEDAPSAGQVVAGGEELSRFFPKWGRLAPEVGASCGPRWGEMFQLTAYDIDRSGQKPKLLIYAQIDPAGSVRRGDDRRKLPKGEKTRETGIPEVTFTGYPLRAELEKRRIQALAEQAAGLNPEALLFPAAKGGMHHHSSGGRQLGKSALLRTAERQFRDSGPARESVLTSLFTVGSDGDATKLWLSLWPLLAERNIVSGDAPATGAGTAVHAGILSWLAGDSNRSLLILLDEADAFLDADAAGNQFTNVEWCRRIMEDSGRRAKVVFAGLHRTARFDSLPNQPLSHFGPAIVVGPLRPQHAYDLLTRPLQAVGFRFEDDSTPARVLALANNMPALLQLFGAALMEKLTSQPLPPDAPVQLVTNADVDAVFNNAELKDAFREKYRLTLNLDPRYQVIAYTVAGAAHERGVDAGLTLTELSTDARSTWPAGFAGCGSDDFGGLVKECVDLGLLAVDDDRYRMRTPMVLRLLGTEDEVLGTLLNAPERLSVPSTADAGAYRRMIGHARSPLTERQLGALFATHGRTVVIAGSPAFGNDRAISTVETALQLGAGRVAKFARAHTATPDGLRGTANKMGVAGLIMCDARTLTTTALTALLHAGGALTEASPGLTIAVVTGPVNAPAWLNWPQRIDLTRWDASGLRMLCDEENLPFRDSTTQSDLLAATGGWPPLLGRAIEACHGSGAVPSGEQILSQVEAWIDSAAASKLLDAAGVGTAAPVLRAALARISELTNSVGEDTANLAELLEMADEDLTPSCQEAGFANLEEVIVALAALACLFDDGQGGWRAEGQISTIVQTCAGVEA